MGREGYCAEVPATPTTVVPRTATFASRVVALMLDWLIANIVAFAIFRDGGMFSAPTTALDLAPLAVFAVETWLFTGLFGSSLGQLIRGIGVVQRDGQPIGLWRALIRTILILFVIPPLVMTGGRGLHDKAVGTVVLVRRAPRT
ncbi:MAG TPA: RDD family protein [Actinopolymorphaceae bacterium]